MTNLLEAQEYDIYRMWGTFFYTFWAILAGNHSSGFPISGSSVELPVQ